MAVNVLIVDDSDVIRSMILKTMRLARVPLGSTFEASNGREALKVLQDQWVDVVLADLNMPVMDGIEMIEHIRRSKDICDVPVVVISTEGAESRIELLRRLGVVAYLRKPFTPEQVRDIINEVAGQIVGSGHREVLEKSMGRVLELFAMMYGEAVDAVDGCVPAGDLIRARMTFTGAANGALTLAAPRDLCLQMAANAMGIECTDERASLRSADAFGEAVNMACGLIATALDAHDETSLCPPEVTAMSSRDWESMASEAGAVMFMVEDTPLLAALGVRTQQ